MSTRKQPVVRYPLFSLSAIGGAILFIAHLLPAILPF